jgi:hypothetical protein
MDILVADRVGIEEYDCGMSENVGKKGSYTHPLGGLPS